MSMNDSQATTRVNHHRVRKGLVTMKSGCLLSDCGNGCDAQRELVGRAGKGKNRFAHKLKRNTELVTTSAKGGRVGIQTKTRRD